MAMPFISCQEKADLTIWVGSPRIVSMIGDSETRWISIRLANGEHYTVFKHGDRKPQRLLLTPASEKQEEADIEFYYHASCVSEPIRIGVIKFANLPAKDVELALESELTIEGTLSVRVRHEASGRMKNLKVQIPDAEVKRSHTKQNLRLRSGIRWFLGVLYVALGLAIVSWLVWLVTDFGEYELPPPPISHSAVELSMA